MRPQEINEPYHFPLSKMPAAATVGIGFCSFGGQGKEVTNESISLQWISNELSTFSERSSGVRRKCHTSRMLNSPQKFVSLPTSPFYSLNNASTSTSILIPSAASALASTAVNNGRCSGHHFLNTSPPACNTFSSSAFHTSPSRSPSIT